MTTVSEARGVVDQDLVDRAMFFKALQSDNVFRLCEPNDVDVARVAESNALFRAPVLFITYATADQLQSPSSPGVTGTTVSLSGYVCDENVVVSASDITDLGDEQRKFLLKLRRDIAKVEEGVPGSPTLRGLSQARALNSLLSAALLAYFRCAPDALQADVAALIEEKRWASSVWMERDRANLSLTDNLTGNEVFNLWDDDFYQAIEDGYLTSPRGPRPRDADWHQPALAYARDSGAMESFSLECSGLALPNTEEHVRDRQRG